MEPSREFEETEVNIKLVAEEPTNMMDNICHCEDFEDIRQWTDSESAADPVEDSDSGAADLDSDWEREEVNIKLVTEEPKNATDHIYECKKFFKGEQGNPIRFFRGHSPPLDQDDEDSDSGTLDSEEDSDSETADSEEDSEPEDVQDPFTNILETSDIIYLILVTAAFVISLMFVANYFGYSSGDNSARSVEETCEMKDLDVD